MKKLSALFCFLLVIGFAKAQEVKNNQVLDEVAILQSIEAVIDDTAKVNKILRPYGNLNEINPMLSFRISQKRLMQARKTKDLKTEAYTLSGIGRSYRMMGNTIKSLEFALQSVQVASQTGDSAIILSCIHNLAHNYKDQEQYDKAISMYKQVEQGGFHQKIFNMQCLALLNLGEVYLKKGVLDSALMYSQNAYDIINRIQFNYYRGSVFSNLGSIHSSLGNNELAVSYFKMALAEANKLNSPRNFNNFYYELAQHYYRNQQPDSAILYAKKAIRSVQNTDLSNQSLLPAKLLSAIYRKTNADSALKYQDMYIAANDSMYSAKNIQQTQLMSTENELKQQESAIEKIKAIQQRKQNIQYALLGLGIITFIILFLALSRRHITNTKLIQFLGVIALLVVFEFLNLLLHPFLERITHHSPVLMLLALVCIAALLVPLHHKLEKWATHKLVEKNKQIRLASAKKTIRLLSEEELENKQSN